MNILYVCADRGIALLGNKGASAHVRSITGALHQLGHRVTIAIRRIDAGNLAPEVHRIEQLHKEADRAADQLARLIRAERTDVVIERYSLQSGAARVATRRHGVALTLEVNAPLVAEATRYRGLDDPGAQAREHAILQSADAIHVVSTALLRYVRSVAPDVPSTWIPNGARVDQFRVTKPAELPAAAGRLVVGFVGSMKPWHGVEQLLDAFAAISATTGQPPLLVLVGGGPQEQVLRIRAEEASLRARVLFTGAVPQHDVASFVRRFDVAVAPYLPTDDFYFHPLKVVEYLAAGRPVVYADQGDLRQLVGAGGLGYPPGDPAQLANALTTVLQDDQLRSDLATAASARAHEFDWPSIAERIVRFARQTAEPTELCSPR